MKPKKTRKARLCIQCGKPRNSRNHYTKQEEREQDAWGKFVLNEMLSILKSPTRTKRR